MQVILLADVEKVGLRGDVVDVARGYARNFLLPRKLAETATPARVAELKKRGEQRACQEASTLSGTRARFASRDDGAVVRRQGRADRLATPVTATDLADEIWRRQDRVDRRKIRVGDPTGRRPLRGARRAVHRRDRRRDDPDRARGRRAAARGGVEETAAEAPPNPSQAR